MKLHWGPCFLCVSLWEAILVLNHNIHEYMWLQSIYQNVFFQPVLMDASWIWNFCLFWCKIYGIDTITPLLFTFIAMFYKGQVEYKHNVKIICLFLLLLREKLYGFMTWFRWFLGFFCFFAEYQSLNIFVCRPHNFFCCFKYALTM